MIFVYMYFMCCDIVLCNSCRTKSIDGPLTSEDDYKRRLKNKRFEGYL